MSDETPRALLASLTAMLADLETGASESDPAAAARAFDAMTRRRRLERDRAAKAALAEATRPPERPWFDEALPPRPPANDSCPECGASPLPASRTLPCGHAGCRECLDRKLLDGFPAACALCRAPLGPTVARAQLFEASRANRPDAIARLLRLRLEPEPHAEDPAASASISEADAAVVDDAPEALDDARDSAGATPLMIACDFDAVDAARVLLTAGASTSARDAEGLTPLHRACWRGSSACAEALLDAGADPNATDDAEETPAMVAARVNDAASLRALLRFGADLDRRDENGWTAAEKAAARAGCGDAVDVISGWIAAGGGAGRGGVGDDGQVGGSSGEEYDPDELD